MFKWTETIVTRLGGTEGGKPMDAEKAKKEIGRAQEYINDAWRTFEKAMEGLNKMTQRLEKEVSDLKPEFDKAFADFSGQPGVSSVTVTVNEGNVVITGDMKSLTINGKLVRFPGEAPPEKKTEDPKS